eukprot:2878724-Rhodomonas_salina.1
MADQVGHTPRWRKVWENPPGLGHDRTQITQLGFLWEPRRSADAGAPVEALPVSRGTATSTSRTSTICSSTSSTSTRNAFACQTAARLLPLLVLLLPWLVNTASVTERPARFAGANAQRFLVSVGICTVLPCRSNFEATARIPTTTSTS